MFRKFLPLCQMMAVVFGQFNGAYMAKRWGGQALSSAVLKRDAVAETADQTEYIEVWILIFSLVHIFNAFFWN